MSSGRLSRAAVFALVLLLTVLLALWGAFLVPLRLGGRPFPVGVVLALATAPLCRAGGRVLGRRAGAAVPMALWTLIAVGLSRQRREGDLVVTGGLRGLGFLLVGLLAAAVVVGSWRPDPRSGVLAPVQGASGRDTPGGAGQR